MFKAHRHHVASRWLRIALLPLACVLLASPAQAERAEIAARLKAETCEAQIEALEKELFALGRELAALKQGSTDE